jgi:sulfite exporter TauE/SafE/copper chaperone CopZ
MLQKIKFKIKGLHCSSCKTLIEEEIKNLTGVKSVDVDYKNGQTQVEFEDEQISQSRIFAQIKKLNYSPEEISAATNKADFVGQGSFWLGLLIPLGIIILLGLYLIFKQFGGFEILAKLNEGNVSYGLIFIIGLLAGFHCIGMCGSIVVTYSTLCLEPGQKALWPHWQYNLGRIVSYTIIGGILGGFGAFFGVNPFFNGIVTILAGILMFILGLSLVFKANFLEKIKLKTPKFIAQYIFSHKGKKTAPLVIGLLNGFMPCGPLQAMQLYALTSGNFIKGALSLLIYAVGTSILLFSFGAFLSLINQKQIKNILKISGGLVLVLSLLMINRGLANFGYKININTQQESQNQITQNNGPVQEVRMAVTYYGYEPNVLTIKKGLPVRWIIDVQQLSGCTSQILLPDYNISKNLVKGENIIEFTPTKSGEIKFSCGMRMIWGKFIVNE